MGLQPLILFSSLSFICLLIFLKRRKEITMRYCTIEKSLRGKIVLITGASSGLGKELTFELARRGAEIVMGCRNLEKANDAIKWVNDKLTRLSESSKKHAESPVKLHVLPLDLSSLVSVESFAQQFLTRFNNLHVLVNNAGIMGGQYIENEAGIEMHMAVNHLGHFHLTNLLLDVLKRSAPSRIVIVSSGYYRKAKAADLLHVKSPDGYEPLTAYARSKLANCLHALGLSRRLPSPSNSAGIGVYALRPGFVRDTELGRNFSRLHALLIYPVLWLFSKSPNQGVQTYLHCCLSDPADLKSGSLYNDCQVDDTIDFRLVNQEAAEELWKKSVEWTEDSLLQEKAQEK